ncbi:MAG: hypothetical protein RL748_4441 [Pseudomonadota bacterium]|jgi:uncharacterized protein (DUF924 family)
MYQEIIKFWFEEIKPSQWWKKDKSFDQIISERFSDIHAVVARCECFDWRQHARGRLAEIIVLDQFSRNMFRDSARAFAYDSLALALAQEAVAAGADLLLNQSERSFLYMPYMHSESLKIHAIATELFEENGLQNNIDFELKHRNVIEQFGRYPHRNAILGRESTAEELEFLKQPGSRF